MTYPYREHPPRPALTLWRRFLVWLLDGTYFLASLRWYREHRGGAWVRWWVPGSIYDPDSGCDPRWTRPAEVEAWRCSVLAREVWP